MPAFVAPVLAFITRFLATFVTREFLVPLITRIGIYFGISLITYTGASVMLNLVLGKYSNGASGLPAAALQVLQMTNVLNACNVVMSAIVASLTIKGLTSATGTVSKLALTPNKGQDVFSGLGNQQFL